MTFFDKIWLKPIGFVRTEVGEDRIREEWQSLVSELVIYDEFGEALEGIEGFSHIFVLFWMHKITSEGRKLMKVHPRRREDLPLVGVFATRSSHRPNPLGLTLVKVLERKGCVLKVQGLDAVNGTPIIDIKPYDPHSDVAREFRIPEWRVRLEKD